MRILVKTLVLAVAVCRISSLQAEDGLFSEVAMESVFEKNVSLTADVASLGNGETLERVTGATSLMLALKFAGYTPTQNGDQVTLQVDHAGWKLPVTLQVDLEQDRIVCQMSLSDIPDPTKLDTNTALKLLESSDAARGYFFAYDASVKAIQLRTAFSNRAITAKQLKANLIQIATFADSHSELWTNLNSRPTTDDASTATKKGSTTTVVPVSVIKKPSPFSPNSSLKTLSGLWGSTLKSGESIAIQISVDGTFKLVTVKSGKSSISKGKATLVGNKLTLVGDDKTTIHSNVSQDTSSTFTMAIFDQNDKPTLSIDFTKSK